MQKDQYERCIFDIQDMFDILYNHDISVIEKIIVKDCDEIQKFNSLNNNIVKTSIDLDNFENIEEFDKTNQLNWFMPEEYQRIDIESYLVDVCPEENYERLINELQEYRSRNMLSLLKWLKYFVDTLRSNGIVWGVGRGSSVASYTLYLLGVHKIDSIKYKLDYKEFLR